MFWRYLIFFLKKENDNKDIVYNFWELELKKLFNDIELRLYRLIVNESWWYVNINVYKMLKIIFLEILLMIDIYVWNLFYDLMK